MYKIYIYIFFKMYINIFFTAPLLRVLRSWSCMLDGRDMFSRGIWVLSVFSVLRLAESLYRKHRGAISGLDQMCCVH